MLSVHLLLLPDLQTQHVKRLAGLRSSGHARSAQLQSSAGVLATSGPFTSCVLYHSVTFYCLLRHRVRFFGLVQNSPTGCEQVRLYLTLAMPSLSRFSYRCNYGRGAMQMVYQGLNIVAQVLGVVVSLLCGVRRSFSFDAMFALWQQV